LHYCVLFAFQFFVFMQPKSYRLLALVIVIAVPVFFFLVFQPLGKIPRPKSPRKLHPVDVIQSENSKGETVADTIYHTIANAKLQTQSGDSLALDSLRGNIYVADFFFVSCPGICPQMTNQMQRVQKAFIKNENLKLVSFTVDTERDSVPVLKAYADRHNAVPGKWHFLRGSKEQVFDLAKNSFFVTAKEDEEEDFIHSEKFILVDWDGNIRGYYNGLDTAKVGKMMGDIVLLLMERQKGYSFMKKDKK
jgi:protein SCO1/2